ncbi:MAG: DUF2804 domain-containing protein, partial [Treponema sp.]|nr:DUF2804 domain-containing protein [Treponema sp.]
RGELVLSEPAYVESLVYNLPWRNDKYAFRYSRTSPWYAAEGVIQFGPAQIIFSGGNAWGIFDWNRSVRPRADIRYWAASCGLSHGRLVGFSIGHGLIDSSVCTENAFFADGKLHKLDKVTFHIPPSNWFSPWRFTSNDSRLEMIFSPLQMRVDRRQMLYHTVNRRQVYGSFSGKVVLDDGAEMDFYNITGFAEWCKMRF